MRQSVSPWELYSELKRRQAQADIDNTSAESDYTTHTHDCSLSDMTSCCGSHDSLNAPALTPCASDASTQTTNSRKKHEKSSKTAPENLSTTNHSSTQSVKYLRDVITQSRDLSVRSKVTEKGTRSRSSMGGQSNRSQLSEDSGIEVAARSSVCFRVSTVQLVSGMFLQLLYMQVYTIQYMSCSS